MKLKLLLIVSIIAFALHSCSKDDGPKEEANNPPSISDKTVSVSEAITPGTTVGTLTATDADDDTLTFSITGNPGPFKISTDGVLTLASGQTLDFDVTNSYTITVSVSDGTDSATATITINVTNVNEAPEIADQGFEVSEDSEVGVTLYTLENVSDPDGDPLTFEISANDNGLFAINNDGKISLAEGQSLDYETATSHQITVSVSDGTDATEATVTITVTNVIESLFEDPDSFILKLETSTENESMEIGTYSEDPDLVYDFEIDWGDGSLEQIVSAGSVNHIYASPNTYLVAIKGMFPRIMMHAASEEDRQKLVGIEQWGAIEWESMSYAFYGCYNLEYNATDNPNLSKVTDMSSMFQDATAFDGDLSNWDVSTVTNMSYMFAGASLFNGNISEWKVYEVTNMSNMFNSAISFDSDISNWPVFKVTNMSSMFKDAISFNQNLSAWNFNNFNNMSNAFDNSAISTENYDAMLTAWADDITIQENTILGAEGLKYCEASTKRNYLIVAKGWTFIGDQECQN